MNSLSQKVSEVVQISAEVAQPGRALDSVALRG